MSIISGNLKALRKSANISQARFAAIFRLAVLTINRYENDKSTPSLKFILEICIYFKISLRNFLKKEQDSFKYVEKKDFKKNLIRINSGKHSSKIPNKYISPQIIPPVEPPNCKSFGCRKILTFTEQLFGNLCASCSSEELIVSNFNVKNVQSLT